MDDNKGYPYFRKCPNNHGKKQGRQGFWAWKHVFLHMNSWFWSKQELDFHHFKAQKIGFQPWNMAWKPLKKGGWSHGVPSLARSGSGTGSVDVLTLGPNGPAAKVDDIGYSLWTNDPLRSILGKLSTTGTSQFTLENYHFCGWFAYYYYQRVRISGLFYASSAGSSLDSSKEKTSSGTKNQAPLRAKMFFPGKPETHSLRWWRLMIHCPKVTCKKHQMKQQMFEELLINWPVPSI